MTLRRDPTLTDFDLEGWILPVTLLVRLKSSPGPTVNTNVWQATHIRTMIPTLYEVVDSWYIQVEYATGLEVGQKYQYVIDVPSR